MAPLPPRTSCILGVPVGTGGCWVPLSPGSCSEMPGGVFFGVVVTFFSFFLYITAQDVVAARLSTAIFFSKVNIYESLQGSAGSDGFILAAGAWPGYNPCLPTGQPVPAPTIARHGHHNIQRNLEMMVKNEAFRARSALFSQAGHSTGQGAGPALGPKYPPRGLNVPMWEHLALSWVMQNSRDILGTMGTL